MRICFRENLEALRSAKKARDETIVDSCVTRLKSLDDRLTDPNAFLPPLPSSPPPEIANQKFNAGSRDIWSMTMA
jgi:hypothetical protein